MFQDISSIKQAVSQKDVILVNYISNCKLSKLIKIFFENHSKFIQHYLARCRSKESLLGFVRTYDLKSYW